jgi:hypothetical protein
MCLAKYFQLLRPNVQRTDKFYPLFYYMTGWNTNTLD